MRYLSGKKFCRKTIAGLAHRQEKSSLTRFSPKCVSVGLSASSYQQYQNMTGNRLYK